MIQTYFGNGKGKTTASVGLAIRCTGCGNKVLYVQFLKNNDSSEFNVLEKIEGIDILYSNEHYTLYDNLNKDRTIALSKAYKKLLFEDVKSKADNYQMVVLDEILDAVQYGYIDEYELLDFLSKIKEKCEIILTGHKITEKISKKILKEI